jgi:hypothetical protein
MTRFPRWVEIQEFRCAKVGQNIARSDTSTTALWHGLLSDEVEQSESRVLTTAGRELGGTRTHDTG